MSEPNYNLPMEAYLDNIFVCFKCGYVQTDICKSELFNGYRIGNSRSYPKWGKIFAHNKEFYICPKCINEFLGDISNDTSKEINND